MARGGRNRSDEVTEGNSAGPFMRGSFSPKLGVFRREGEIQAELRYHRRGRLGFRPLAFGLGGTFGRTAKQPAPSSSFQFFRNSAIPVERDVYVIRIRREVTTGTGKVVARRSPFQPEGTSLEVTLVMGSRSLGRPSSGGLGARRGERGGVPSCFSPAQPAQPKAYTVSIFFFLSRMAYHVYEAGPPRLSYPNRG